jgi:hypothetical protein
LKQTVSARSLATGDSFTGLADDITAISYNPSGLNNLNEKEVGTMYAKGISDICYGFIGIAIPVQNNKCRFGLSAKFLDAGEIEINYIDGITETVKSEQDFLYTFSFATKLFNSSVNFGININYLVNTLAEKYTYYSYSSDIGLLTEIPVNENNLGIGICLQNIRIKFDNDTNDNFPLVTRLGLNYNITIDKKTINLLSDIIYSNEFEKWKINTGLEFWLTEKVAFRTGYRIGYTLDSITFGTGLKLNNLKIDFGLALLRVYTSNFRISFIYSF